MKAGKIAESVLKRSVLKEVHRIHEDVLIPAAVGEDCSAIGMSAACAAVLSTDTVTGPLNQPEALAMRGMLKAANNLATTGAQALGVMLSVLIPTSANEPELRALMAALSKEGEKYGLQILGGHTEVSRSVNEAVVTLTGIGKAENVLKTAGIKPGMDIIVSKWIGLQGTVYIAKEKEEELREHFTVPFLHKAKELELYLPIQSEAAVAIKSGVAAMHDASEGGIFAALWEFAESAGVGLEIDLKKIPIRQETVELCEYVGVNPYKLLSAGCLLMAADDGNQIVRELEKAQIPATIIGKATAGNDRLLINEDEGRFLETPQTDEIYSL